MAKYKAIVNVEYQFEFESDSENRHELNEIVEDMWNAMSSSGLEDEKYHDTEYDFQEIR